MTRAERAAFVAAVRLALVAVAVLVGLIWFVLQQAPDYRVEQVLSLRPANEVEWVPALAAAGVRRDAFSLGSGESARFHVIVPGDDAVLRFHDLALFAHPDVAVRVAREGGDRIEVAVVQGNEDAWGVHRVPLGIDAGEEVDLEIAVLDGRSKPGLAELAVADVVLESRGRAVDENEHPVQQRIQTADLLASVALEMISSPRTAESARVGVPGPGLLPLDTHAARVFDLGVYGEGARAHLVVHAARASNEVPTRAGTVRVSQGEVVLGVVPVVLPPSLGDQEWMGVFELDPLAVGSPLRVELLGSENVVVGLREAYITVPESHARRPYDPDTSVNVLLVVVEGLSADRLGCSGWKPARTPVLDALAARGLRYEQVVAPSSWAVPNVASLFTGLSPVAHGLGLADDRILSPRAVTLARSAAWSGITTACFASGGTVLAENGLGLGMETLWTGSSGAPEVVEKALDWLVDASQFEWFLTLVLDDPLPPHETFVADVEGRDMQPDPAVVERLRALDARPGMAEGLAFEVGLSYDGEVTRVDRALGVLFDALASRKLLENTLVCVVGAHGLEAYEHGGRLAGQTLFDEVVHVPVILAGPRVLGRSPPPLVERDVVELVDVSMLLGDLGRLLPASQRSGRIPPPFGPRVPDTTVHGLLRPVEGVTRRDLESSRRGPWLRVYDREADRASLFDLAKDPGAQIDLLASDDPVRAAEAASTAGALAAAFESWYLDELARELARPVPVGP